MTSTADTTESTIRDNPGELSIDMALNLPLMRNVVFLHFVIKIEC